MKFWWVNHKQTAQQEIGGGYLWSPKREANGARSQFYENMRLASPGDFILSYANGIISHVGVVIDYTVTAPKPNSFGLTGSNWSDVGWLLPTKWTKLPTPIPPKNILKQISPLLPTKYSPIQAETGNGNQKAYLAEIGEPLFTLIAGLGGTTSEALSSNAVPNNELALQLDETLQREIDEEKQLSDTEKHQLTLARQGQGLFRNRVAAIEKACRVTKITHQALLVASHVKPWRACLTAAERLDGQNGLMLAPHVDRLFDRGLISFSDEGDILISSKLDPSDLDKLGLTHACELNCGAFSPRQAKYLFYHRENVFLP